MHAWSVERTEDIRSKAAKKRKGEERNALPYIFPLLPSTAMGWRFHCTTTVIVQYRPTRDMPIKASDNCASPIFIIDPKTVCRSSKQVSGGTSKFDFHILVSSPARYSDLADFRQERHSVGNGRYQNAARCSLSISFRHCGGS
jgi:hypothetical protein